MSGFAIQSIRFSLIGIFNALIDVGVLNLMLFLHPPRYDLQLLGYNTLAVIAALVNSYILNAKWTFRTHANLNRREILLFIAQAVVNILVNNILLLVALNLLQGFDLLPGWIDHNAAKTVAMIGSSTASFFMMRGIVFRRKVN